MAEYAYNPIQSVALNNPLIFESTIPCNKGYIFHEDGDGIFILKGITANQCNCFARYQITYNGNIAVPEAGELTPIGLVISINGEGRPSSKAIFTPAAVDEYGNVTCTCIVTIPRGCCFSMAVRYVSSVNDETVTPTPVINVQNSNLVINRVA